MYRGQWSRNSGLTNFNKPTKSISGSIFRFYRTISRILTVTSILHSRYWSYLCSSMSRTIFNMICGMMPIFSTFTVYSKPSTSFHFANSVSGITSRFRVNFLFNFHHAYPICLSTAVWVANCFKQGVIFALKWSVRLYCDQIRRRYIFHFVS